MLASYSIKRKNDEGFTLIELLIVVIIIGVLAAIALPIFIDQQKVAVDASVQSDVRNTVTNVVNAQAQNATTVKAAVSRAGTSIALSDLTNVAKSSVVTRSDPSSDTTFSAVPALGDSYTLQGYNSGGKKYQGTGNGLNGKAFTFTSATGRFTQSDSVTDGASADPGTGSNPNGGQSTSYEATVSSTSWDGSEDNNTFVAQQTKFSNGTLSTFKISGDYDFLNGEYPCSRYGGETFQKAVDASDITLTDGDGNVVATPNGAAWLLNYSYRCETYDSTDPNTGAVTPVSFTGAYVALEYNSNTANALPTSIAKVEFVVDGKTYSMEHPVATGGGDDGGDGGTGS